MKSRLVRSFARARARAPSMKAPLTAGYLKGFRTNALMSLDVWQEFLLLPSSESLRSRDSVTDIRTTAGNKYSLHLSILILAFIAASLWIPRDHSARSLSQGNISTEYIKMMKSSEARAIKKLVALDRKCLRPRSEGQESIANVYSVHNLLSLSLHLRGELPSTESSSQFQTRVSALIFLQLLSLIELAHILIPP